MISFLKTLTKRYVPYRIYAPILDSFRYMVSLRYTGNTYVCPFCHGHFSKLLPSGLDLDVFREKEIIGGGYRPNALCPRCYSCDRERLIYVFLRTSKNDVFIHKIKLLHVAPEKCLSLKLKQCPNIDYYSADLDSPLVDLHMDITDIRQDNETYDVIICNHVLEHIPDDMKAMKELYRVLKKNGFAILQVPISYAIASTIEDPLITDPDDRERLFGQNDHVRIYGSDYTTRLSNAGFSVTAYECNEKFSRTDVKKYGLLEDERIFFCNK